MRTSAHYIIALILFYSLSLSGQVKIGFNPETIDPGSILELESDSKVLVISRLTDSAMNALIPLRGALVYNTDAGCIYYYDGSRWINLCEDTGAVNISLETNEDSLVLLDSNDNTVSVPLDSINTNTFTSNPIVNPAERDSTIVITQTGNNYNFEVGMISGENIIDTSINGQLDIQNGSITGNKIQNDAINASLINENVAGTGLTQDATGALQVDVSLIAGDGALSSPNATIAITGEPSLALFDDVGIDIATGSANQVLKTNAAGTNVEWAILDATSLAGQNLTATDGSITVTNGTGATLVAMDLGVNVDDATLEVDPTNGLQVKDNGITIEKIGTEATDTNRILGTDATGNPQWQNAAEVATSLGENVTSTDGSITGIANDAALVAMDLEVNVDDATLEVDPTNGLQVKDNGITIEKIGTEATDANRILGTDAAGNPQWQNAAEVATSLGENVTSTDGSITGIANDAALVAMDLEVNVDDATLEVDPTNGLQVKDNGITIEKIGTEATDTNRILGTDATGNPQWQNAAEVATSLGENVTSTDGSITGIANDAALVAMDLEVNVDDATLEVDPTNGLQVKDNGITIEKIGTEATDANRILGTDAAGNPQWQNAAEVATSLGENVTSTDGSITGIANDAALVAMDLEVNVDDATLEVDPTNGLQVKDNGITIEKIGTEATDTNRILGTDATGNPQWQNAAEVATSLGENVTSTDGSITGIANDAALVAMDLEVNVDDATLEVDPTNGLQVKDNGITIEKIGTEATDTNRILGTDATGNPQWQNAAEVATSLGENVTSTDGSITGIANDAALVAMDLEVNVDDATLEVDPTNGLQVKDNGITIEKIGTEATDTNRILGTDATGNPQWQNAAEVATSLGENVTSTDGSITGIANDAALVAMDLEVNVDDATLEVDPTNGLQVKDNGITIEKIGTEATDANRILGTDATGNPQWQNAAEVATSLGENVTSTDGSITGIANDAALVAMDLEVNVDDATLEVDPTNGLQVKDNGITIEKIGTEATDANRILGTDAAGNPQWQNAAEVATSLGENVTSTDGSITGIANDAALVAMDLEVNVDDATLEVDPTNGLQVKDNGITIEKIGTEATDANRILGTDAAGNPQWQNAAEVATSLGENVTSTDGSITGIANDAALVAMDLEVNVDDATLEVDPTNGLQVKDNGITIEKIGTEATDTNRILGTDATGNPQWQNAAEVATSLGENVTSTDGSITGIANDAALVAMDLEVNVDDATLEVDPTNGLQVKDNGITIEKIGTEATDTNRILGTDATGNPQWQNAAEVATSLGENVTSTDGSITGIANDAALVAMDLEVNVDDATLEVDPTNGLQVKDNGITIEKIGTEATDANKILGTDATGNPQWQNAEATVTAIAGSVFFADGTNGVDENNAQLFWDNTNQVLAIGTNTPDVSGTIGLHVIGSTRSGGFITSAGSAATPSYRFNDDPDTGIFWGGIADQLGFSVGGIEALRIRDEGTTDSELIVNGSLELTEQVLDENGNTGNAGNILTATATGTEWTEPSVIAMGKLNGGNTIRESGGTVSGNAGEYTVTLDNARPNANYVVQLTVFGDNRIYLTNQTANTFSIEIRDNSTNSLVIADWFYTILDF